MMLARVNLENFEPVDGANTRKSSDYKQGFEEGQRAAFEELEMKSATALSEIAASLSDISFGYIEARSHLIEQIKPIMAQITEGVLPQILKGSFSDYLMETVLSSFDAATDTAIEIFVSPDSVADISSSLPISSGARLVCSPDPDLSQGQVRLRQTDTHVIIDLPEMLQTLHEALQGLETIERNATND